MEDWQGCLAPQCQIALQHARDSIVRRGGYAITIEDFLLALLDGEPSVTRFLRNRGVDIDELVRTIQSEQPVVTGVTGEGQLSSQLQYWFSLARELSGAEWLDWPLLLRVLVRDAERLQAKAYVAVLELVADWRMPADEQVGKGRGRVDGDVPIVITDESWLQLAEDIGVVLSVVTRSLLWVHGPRGAGKSSWLQAMLPSLGVGFLVLDLRRQNEVMHCDYPVFPRAGSDEYGFPLLVLDNTSPADLVAMMASETHLASQLLPAHRGPILLLAPDGPGQESACEQLEQALGRTLERVAMPGSSASQNLAILTAHQPAIEKRWNVELSLASMRFAVESPEAFATLPGRVIQWVERAAARLALFATRGPVSGQVLDGEMDTLRRQMLVAMARNYQSDDFDNALASLELERCASEVAWHERRRGGTLRTLTSDDLRFELERLGVSGTGGGNPAQRKLLELVH